MNKSSLKLDSAALKLSDSFSSNQFVVVFSVFNVFIFVARTNPEVMI